MGDGFSEGLELGDLLQELLVDYVCFLDVLLCLLHSEALEERSKGVLTFPALVRKAREVLVMVVFIPHRDVPLLLHLLLQQGNQVQLVLPLELAVYFMCTNLCASFEHRAAITNLGFLPGCIWPKLVAASLLI